MGVIVNPVLPTVSAIDAPLIANTTSELSILGPRGICTFTRDSTYQLGEGSTIGFRMFGKISNRANNPGTLTLRAKLGAAKVWDGGPVQLPSSAHAGITFWLDVLLVLRAGGANAKVMGCGLLQAVLGSQTDYLLPAGGAVDSATFDAVSSDLDLDITAQFSAADVGNKFQLQGYQVLA